MEEKMLQLEKTLVAVLSDINGLHDRISPVIELCDIKPPLVVYEETTETETQALDGATGLFTAKYVIHAFGASYKAVRILGERVRSKLRSLDGLSGEGLLIENINIELAAQDRYSSKSVLYRRAYSVTINYQIKEE